MACGHRETKLHTDAVLNRAGIPILDTRDVTTLISDSGITRYRITTPRWLVFDKDTPAHWLFPEGIYLEKFDTLLAVDAQLRADSAYYDTDAQIWTLVGQVHALNLDSEQFDTPWLRWEQSTEQIYSDTVISITRPSPSGYTVINGVGFRSNQEMTQYRILRPTGIIPVSEK